MISYQMSVQYVVNKKCIVDCSWPELAPLQVSVSCPLSALFRDPSVESQHQLLSTSPRHRSQTVTTRNLASDNIQSLKLKSSSIQSLSNWKAIFYIYILHHTNIMLLYDGEWHSNMLWNNIVKSFVSNSNKIWERYFNLPPCFSNAAGLL